LKLIIIATAALALAAGPALAQGSFNNGKKPAGAWRPAKPTTSLGDSSIYRSPSSTYGSSPTAPTAKIYGAPEPPKPQGFKPYQPYKPTSVYGKKGP